MKTSISGLLVVDLQPAYARPSAGSSISSHLMRNTLAHIASLDDETPVTVLYVCEELSGDTLLDVHEFWREHGADDELIERLNWVEKPFGFLRGWMDNGIDEDDICAVLQELRKRGSWDSRDLPEDTLEKLSSDGFALSSPLFRDEAVDNLLANARRAGGHWETCGGGQNECLQEVELVFQSGGVPFERLHHLTY